MRIGLIDVDGHNFPKDDPELTYTREKVDQRLRKICGEKFDPWEVRYTDDQ